MINKSNYYIDIEAIIKNCEIVDKKEKEVIIVKLDPEEDDLIDEDDIDEEDEDELIDNIIKEEYSNDNLSINMFKYDLYNKLIIRLFDEYPNEEDEKEKILLNDESNSFVVDIIVNTLLHDNILKKYDHE